MRIGVPKDHKRYVIKKLIVRFASLAVMLAIAVFVINLYADDLSSGGDVHFWFGVAFKVIMLIIPFIVSGIPLKLFDSSFSGKILYVKIKDILDTKTNTIPTKSQLYYRPDATVTVDTTDGRVVLRTISGGEMRPDVPIDLYERGRDVYHLYLSRLTVVLPEKGDRRCQCAICGHWNDVGNDNCAACSHTLVKEIIYPETK